MLRESQGEWVTCPLRGQFQSVLTTSFLEVFWAGNYFPAGRIASEALPGWPFQNDTSIFSRLSRLFTASDDPGQSQVGLADLEAAAFHTL